MHLWAGAADAIGTLEYYRQRRPDLSGRADPQPDMNPTPRTPAWFLLTRHWLSLTGVALVTTAGLSFLFVLPQQIRGHVSNPYIGIIIFLILPIVFFTGLALI